jgi:hypothetical protein
MNPLRLQLTYWNGRWSQGLEWEAVRHKHANILESAQGEDGTWAVLPTPSEYERIRHSSLDVSVQHFAQLDAAFARTVFSEPMTHPISLLHWLCIAWLTPSTSPLPFARHQSWWWKHEPSAVSENKIKVLEPFDTLFNKKDYATAEHYWSPNYIQHSG